MPPTMHALIAKKKPLIMGIINITPDSFSGDGLFTGDDCVLAAIHQAKQMIKDGADILDIGGESTGPDAKPVEQDEELRRVLPAIKALHEEFPSMPLSIDTMKPSVAKQAIAAGATIINDVLGLRQDPAMWALAAETGAEIILTHNCAKDVVINNPTVGPEYRSPDEPLSVPRVAQDLAVLASHAMEAGVPMNKIILDPGIGFGKTLEMNLALINHIDHFAPLGFPILLGASRKSFIGRVLDAPPEDRLEGTAATTLIAMMRGVAAVRVHDVRFMSRLVQMTASILQN